MYENKSNNIFFKIFLIYFMFILLNTIDANVKKKRVFRSVIDDYLKNVYDNQMKIRTKEDIKKDHEILRYVDNVENINIKKYEITESTSVANEEMIINKSEKNEIYLFPDVDYKDEIGNNGNKGIKSTTVPALNYGEKTNRSKSKLTNNYMNKNVTYTTEETVISGNKGTKGYINADVDYTNEEMILNKKNIVQDKDYTEEIVKSINEETKMTTVAELDYAELDYAEKVDKTDTERTKSNMDEDVTSSTEVTVKSRNVGMKGSINADGDYTKEKDITGSKKPHSILIPYEDYIDQYNIISLTTKSIIPKIADLNYLQEKSKITKIASVSYDDYIDEIFKNENVENKSTNIDLNKVEIIKEILRNKLEKTKSSKTLEEKYTDNEIFKNENVGTESTNIDLNKVEVIKEILKNKLENTKSSTTLEEKYTKNMTKSKNKGTKRTTNVNLEYSEGITQKIKSTNDADFDYTNEKIFESKREKTKSTMILAEDYTEKIFKKERNRTKSISYSDLGYKTKKKKKTKTKLHDSGQGEKTSDYAIKPIIRQDNDTRDGICKQNQSYAVYVKEGNEQKRWVRIFSKTHVNHETSNRAKVIYEYHHYGYPHYINTYKKCSFNKNFECIRHTFQPFTYYKKRMESGLKDVCCEGYVKDKLKPFDEEGRLLCAPVCDPPCVMARCTRGRKCTCLPGYRKKKYSTNICVPICWGNCGGSCRGECVAPNVCLCKRGFINRKGKLRRCISHCPKPCINSVCSGPSTCKCFSGYMRNATYSHICEPICKENCIHGKCVGPDRCRCDKGYKFKYGRCSAICDKHCGRNGTCIISGTSKGCVCDPGYEFDSRIQECVPRCENCTVTGICVAPNKCTCLPGHMPTKGGGCVFFCSFQCGLGRCIRPDVCLCPRGYIFNKTALGSKCVPSCRGCELGECISPCNCQCPRGYVYHVPKIGKDRRIKCIKTVNSYRYYDDRECKSIYDKVKIMKEKYILMEKKRLEKLKWEEDRKKWKKEYEVKVCEENIRRANYVKDKAQRRMLKTRWLKKQKKDNQQKIENEKEIDAKIRK